MVKPAAIPIMFASAIPTSIKRSGISFINGPNLKEPAKSAVNTTTSLFSLAISKIPSPKPALVSFSFSTTISFAFIFLSFRMLSKNKVFLLQTLQRKYPPFYTLW